MTVVQISEMNECRPQQGTEERHSPLIIIRPGNNTLFCPSWRLLWSLGVYSHNSEQPVFNYLLFRLKASKHNRLALCLKSVWTCLGSWNLSAELAPAWLRRDTHLTLLGYVRTTKMIWCSTSKGKHFWHDLPILQESSRSISGTWLVTIQPTIWTKCWWHNL